MDLQRLNNALFDQLDKLSAPGSDEQIKQRIEQSKAVSSIARDIIANSKLALEVTQHRAEYGITTQIPPMLALSK